MRWLVKSVVFLAPFLLATALLGQDWYEGREAVSRQVLVKFRPGQEGRLGEVAAELDIDNARQVGNDRVILIHSRSRDVTQLVRALAQRPYVQYAEPNYILHIVTVPNDPYFGQLWGLKNTGQSIQGTSGTPGADIKAEPAWTLTTGTNTVVVGVVDTGIDYTHTDLAANVWSNPGGIGGCPARTHGFNAITQTCDPMADHWHGTHVSGTIGAQGNNSTGVVGVNWTTSIMGLKFLDKNGSGTTADAISAIDFAVKAKIAGVNVRVLSNSWGGGGFSQALLDEINYANDHDILFVAAAGNSSRNNDVIPSYPASYNTANMIAVAATDNKDGLASFSNYGSTSVHLGAPGVNVLSTYLSPDSYAYASGTSMATPHVAGAAALILSTMTLNSAGLKSQILSNVDPIPSLSGKTTTGGRLNVCKAIPGCSGPPPPDFTISASPASASVTQGGTASYMVNVGALNSFSSSVSLSVVSSPALNATVTLTPSSVTPGTTSSLTVVTTTATTAGTTYTLTITGTGGSPTLTHSTQVTLVVTAPAAQTFTLAVSPSARTVSRGGTASYTLQVTPSGGFSSAVTLSVAGLPVGWPAASFSLNPVPGGSGSSTMSITVPSNATTGTYPLGVTATGGSVTKTVNAKLQVKK